MKVFCPKDRTGICWQLISGSAPTSLCSGAASSCHSPRAEGRLAPVKREGVGGCWCRQRGPACVQLTSSSVPQPPADSKPNGAGKRSSLPSFLAFPFSRARCRDPCSHPWSLLPLPFLLLPSQIARNELYSPVPEFGVLSPISLVKPVLFYAVL